MAACGPEPRVMLARPAARQRSLARRISSSRSHRTQLDVPGFAPAALVAVLVADAGADDAVGARRANLHHEPHVDRALARPVARGDLVARAGAVALASDLEELALGVVPRERRRAARARRVALGEVGGDRRVARGDLRRRIVAETREAIGRRHHDAGPSGGVTRPSAARARCRRPCTSPHERGRPSRRTRPRILPTLAWDWYRPARVTAHLPPGAADTPAHATPERTLA